MGKDSKTKIKIKLNKFSTHIVPLTSNVENSSHKKFVIAKGYSAASQNYWREEDKHCLTNIRPYTGTSVILPDGDTLTANQQGIINISSKLSKLAQRATVLKNLTSSLLISLGQICNDKCTVIMQADKLYAAKTKDVVIQVETKNTLMTGYRNPSDELYNIPITNTTLQSNNFVMPKLNVLPVQPKKFKKSIIPHLPTKVFMTKKMQRSVKHNVRK